ncbi:hypothetical protein [Anoxybacteroides rupiense]|uniref:hypothetical protein n=1 Tax=Anoxybacteroides rupiense TaxID=311460 RepID=UPI0020135584|nr:hypothetical protein [Anoxybacillus rupiensis]
MQQNNDVDVVTVGESMILFQPMTDGSLKYSPLFTKSIAGAESNVAIGLTRLGKKVRIDQPAWLRPIRRFDCEHACRGGSRCLLRHS